MCISYYKLITLFLLLSGCNAPKDRAREKAPAPGQANPLEAAFPYALDNPDRRIKLKSELTEISGIAHVGNGLLACIQDEKGRIYLLNLAKGEVTREVDFAKDGDFEDVAWTGQFLYAIRSDGKLYRIEGLLTDDPSDRNHKTPLSSRNDVEGLCYDAANNRLLIACKEEAGIDEKMKGKRAVYPFNLKTNEMHTSPALLIDLDALEARAGKGTEFMPSAVDVHPLTGDWYLLSSVGKLLLVFSAQGELKVGKRLDPKQFAQPEGLCFLPDGTLLISNEGKGGKADIQIFAYR